MEFRLVAHLAPPFVITVLLATARITRRGLNVSVGNRTDPDVFIRRWNRKRFDASELALVFDRLPVRIVIGEVTAMRLACDAGARVVNVPQPGVPG